MKLRSLAIVVLAMASAGIALIPLLVQRPFSSQTPAAMALAHALRRVGPPATMVLAIAVIAAVVAVARGRRWWTKALLALPVLAAIAAAWVARENPFEWWFNPLPQPRYVAAAGAAFVQPADLVIAVTIDGDAAAYPVRQLAYHHLVNDTIGRTPAVVTY